MQRTNLRFAFLFVWMTVFTQLANGDQVVNRPSVLFILADDLGIGDLHCYGNSLIDTPAIDSLARDGVLLTNHYAPSPLCAPSRAGFLTGRFNHRTGAVDVPSNRGLDRIALQEVTFGDYFQHAGYATALIGKWHNGLYCRDYLPHQRGFDLFFGFPNGGQDYYRWNLLRNDTPVPQDGRYLTDALNDEAISFIRGHRHQPFALFLAHHVPHVPFQAPQSLIEKYRKRIGGSDNENIATIYAMIEAMDRGLQRVFQTLKEEGLWDNTIIVFTSDNGANLKKVNGMSTERFQGGFTGNKGNVLEQGIRVPAIITWPKKLTGGRKIHTPIHGCDWLPTLFQTTGTEPPIGAKPLDGTDVMRRLTGEPMPELDSRTLPFQKNRYTPTAYSDAAIRQGRWKLFWPGVPVTMKKDSVRDNPSYRRGITEPHWEMPLDRQLDPAPKFKAPTPKLFDLTADPSESKDVSQRYPQIVTQLSNQYDRWFTDVISDWRKSRHQIIEHDQQYWKQQ
ncbi:MAG: sulfatase-like hydrolase/transferase [Rubripirellula sp.]|nr:sulfatase-like hydrolase/transferase [Rubripirellula sp.]